MLNQEVELNKFKDSILSESTLLYIEDNEEEQKSTLEVFGKFFENVLVANNATKGLELYTQNKKQINVILTVCEIPFLQEIRNNCWNVPIVVIAEENNLSILPQIIKFKIADFIFKPIQHVTTLKIFHSILEQIDHLNILEKQQQELLQFKDILEDQTLVSETDLEGNILYVNDLFCEVSGYTREELVGQPHNIVRHPDVSPKIFETLWSTIQNGKVWTGKIKNKAKDGSDFYVKATIFPIFDSKGEVKKYMSSRNLITDEEQEKQKLKKYIMSQRTEKIRYEQEFSEKVKIEVDGALSRTNLANMQKIEQCNTTVKEVQEELHRLRTEKVHASRKVISLEKEAKEKEERSEKIQDAYKEKVDKLLATTKTAYEQYEVVKKKNDGFEAKYKKSQDNIKKFETHIEDYRKKIRNLQDVIKSLEGDIKELKLAIKKSEENKK